MNTNTHALELTQDTEAIAQAKVPVTAGLKPRRAKWLLLPAGLCATIIVVKAAVLVGEIFGIVNTIYDSSLT
jgi:hypothetical protein